MFFCCAESAGEKGSEAKSGDERDADSDTDADTDSCVPGSIERCNGNDVWSYDSCGNMESLVQECAVNEHCEEATDTAECASGCAQYWSGADCDVCSGFNNGDAENCQCPSNEYLPEPGSGNCWTCPLPVSGDSGDCANSGDYYTWTEANAVCPEGFRLPSPEEIAENLFTGAVFDGQRYIHDTCAFVDTCQPVFNSFGKRIWTSKACESGYVSYYFANGELDCRLPEEELTVVCIIE